MKEFTKEEIEKLAEERFPIEGLEIQLAMATGVCQPYAMRSAYIEGFQKALLVSSAGAFTEGDMVDFSEWIVEHSWERETYGEWIRNPNNNPEYSTSAELLTKYLKESGRNKLE